MDAKQYIREEFSRISSAQVRPMPYTALEKVLADPRLKIELLLPPPRFEWRRESIDGHRWFVVDLKAAPTWIVGTFSDQARAVDYANWLNKLEE